MSQTLIRILNGTSVEKQVASNAKKIQHTEPYERIASIEKVTLI